jgi:hypothetical protein
VFILPSGPLELPYLDSLHRIHVIDADAISHGRRAQRARQIIDEVQSDLDAGKRTGAAHRSTVRGRRPVRVARLGDRRQR